MKGIITDELIVILSHHYQGSVNVPDDLNFQSSRQQVSSADYYKIWQFQNKIFSLLTLEFTKSHYKAGFHIRACWREVKIPNQYGGVI